MMQTLRRGLLAGLFAGLVLATFDFVTDGAPGNNFPSVLHWFGITPANSTVSHYGGFFLLIVLGRPLWSDLCGAPERKPSERQSRAPLGAGAWPGLVAALRATVEQHHEP